MKKYIICLFILLCSVSNAETIASKLISVSTIKTEIKTAIESKGQSVTTFDTYASAIASISGEATLRSWEEDYNGPDWANATTSSPIDWNNLNSMISEWTDVDAYRVDFGCIYVGYPVWGLWGGSIAIPNGKALLLPARKNQFAIFDSASLTITEIGDSIADSDFKFQSGIYLASGTVVCVPYRSSRVYLFNTITNNWTAGPTHGMGDYAYNGGTLLPNGKCLFAPCNADNIGIYDPVANTFTAGPAHGAPDGAFSGATLTGSNTVVLTPYNAGWVGLYDYSTNTYSRGVDIGTDTINLQHYAGKGIPTSDGRITFIPAYNANFGFFYPDGMASGTFVYGLAHGITPNSRIFGGGTYLPNGQIIISPFTAANHIYTFNPYDTASGSMVCCDYHPYGNTQLFYGEPSLLTDGMIFFATYAYDYHGNNRFIKTGFTNMDDDWVLGPIMNH